VASGNEDVERAACHVPAVGFLLESQQRLGDIELQPCAVDGIRIGRQLRELILLLFEQSLE
jgi:hypothetical protein